MDAADHLAQLAAAGPGLAWSKMVVDSVRDDGTVNLAQGDAIYEAVPCLNSYLARAAGDSVTVVRWGGGWCVLGKVGAEWAPSSSGSTKITWGTSAPSGAGWVTGTPWVRAGELYIQTAAGGGASAPDGVRVSPTSQGAWRDGSIDTGQPPTQGAWPSYPHPYTGGWFFGSALSGACSGKTVGSMTITLSRTSSAHGSFGRVQPVLFLLPGSAAGPSTPTLGDGPVFAPGLGLGSSERFTLPGSWASALASGSAGGVGASTGTGDGYLIFTGSCGQIDVTFT